MQLNGQANDNGFLYLVLNIFRDNNINFLH